MTVYVVLTVFLVEKGSAESKKPDEDNPEEEPPEKRRDDPEAPWPVQPGGLILRLYSHSLSIALTALFVALVLAASGGQHPTDQRGGRAASATAAIDIRTLVDADSGMIVFRTGRASFCRWAS